LLLLPLLLLPLLLLLLLLLLHNADHVRMRAASDSCTLMPFICTARKYALSGRLW
jgi:hypothetical protein